MALSPSPLPNAPPPPPTAAPVCHKAAGGGGPCAVRPRPHSPVREGGGGGGAASSRDPVEGTNGGASGAHRCGAAPACGHCPGGPPARPPQGLGPGRHAGGWPPLRHGDASWRRAAPVPRDAIAAQPPPPLLRTGERQRCAPALNPPPPPKDPSARGHTGTTASPSHQRLGGVQGSSAVWTAVRPDNQRGVPSRASEVRAHWPWVTTFGASRDPTQPNPPFCACMRPAGPPPPPTHGCGRGGGLSCVSRISPQRLLPQGTSSVTAKEAYGNVTAELCVLTFIALRPCALRPFAAQHRPGVNKVCQTPPPPKGGGR